MVRVGIVGISGYSGGLALEILLNHPQVRVTYVSANNTKGPISDIWPKLSGRTELVCDQFQTSKAAGLCDLLLLAVPHTTAMEITPKLMDAGKKVIDFSADYRLPDAGEYQKWYKTAHSDSVNLKQAVYGLPEFHRSEIKNAALLANPGCYPTAALLGLGPIAATMTEDIQNITIDAKSGVSGAGRKLNAALMFSEVQENFKAYRVLTHQHTPEINRHLSRIAGKDLSVTFVPHLLPINRGILETIYVHLKHKTDLQSLTALYTKFYKTEPFVRVLKEGTQPEIKNVTGTNYCDIGLAVSESGTTVVITCVIDNLMKGAAGQAVQNLNIMCGFKEEEGLLS